MTCVPRLPSTGDRAAVAAPARPAGRGCTAEPRPVRSRSSTTSRMPERSASASTLVSTRRRIRMTLIDGRVTRSVSASAADASRSTRGPEDDGVLVRRLGQRALQLLEAPDDQGVGAGDRREEVGVGAVVLDDDGHRQITGRGSSGDARAGLDLGLVVQQGERELALLRRVDDPLGVVLADGQGEQRLGELLGGLGARPGRCVVVETTVVVADGDDLDRRQQEPGRPPSFGSVVDEDRDVRARVDEAGDAAGVGERHRDRDLPSGMVSAALLAGRRRTWR